MIEKFRTWCEGADHDDTDRRHAPARVLAWRYHRLCRSAGDVEFVAHVDDPVRHPRGADHRVVSGKGADMAGQRDDVVLGFRFHIAVGERCRFPESRRDPACWSGEL